MRRSSGSIPTNIAEGSVKSEREFRQALKVSLGSAAELEYQFMLVRDLGYLSSEEHQSLSGRAIEIRKMLTAFIRTIDRSLGQS
jgi:four helix bundle protein